MSKIKKLIEFSILNDKKYPEKLLRNLIANFRARTRESLVYFQFEITSVEFKLFFEIIDYFILFILI